MDEPEAFQEDRPTEALTKRLSLGSFTVRPLDLNIEQGMMKSEVLDFEIRDSLFDVQSSKTRYRGSMLVIVVLTIGVLADAGVFFEVAGRAVTEVEGETSNGCFGVRCQLDTDDDGEVFAFGKGGV